MDDLQTQFEYLLHCVWAAEADWRLLDRIDLATRADRESRTTRLLQPLDDEARRGEEAGAGS